MFYDKFISLCQEKGVKPTPLVVGMGLSSSNVSQWKKGSTPRPEVLAKLADYFDVTVDELLDESIKKAHPPQMGDELSMYDLRLLKWFRSLTDEKRQALLSLGDAPEELRGE